MTEMTGRIVWGLQELLRERLERAARRWAAPAAVALVWLYQGLWVKVLRASEAQQAVVASALGSGAAATRAVLVGIGLAEAFLAVWVLSGLAPRRAARVQTLALVGMNAAGLLAAADSIPDPGGMVVANLAFLALVWKVAANGQAPGRGGEAVR